MRHDHHQEEIELRWQRAMRRRGEAESAKEESEDMDKMTRPSFWLWVRLSVDNCYLLAATLLSCIVAGYFLLASDGVIQSPFCSERELMIYSVLFGMLAIAMISLLAIMWLRFRDGPRKN